ncbi:MAG: putative transcriptional regulatory protein [Planctomycetes bacterium]|nr:putative transcriptional regulatory protein [Planctomycetota bacterium]
MAGHSHWANIAYKKAALDKRRGKLWSKLARKVMSAAKQGGGNVDANFKLKFAVDAARAANMSNDQIRRIIDKATGAAAGEDYEEAVYEGYAPGGAAVLVEALTDNRNRTAGEVRNAFDKLGGNLGGAGSVAWQFARRASLRMTREGATADDAMAAVLDAGCDDIEQDGGSFVVTGAPESLRALQSAAEAAGFAVADAKLVFVAKEPLPLDAEHARRTAALLEALEDNDDVQQVHTNASFPDGFDA